MWVSEEPRASQEERVHPFSSMLLKAWEAMRGERSAPRREDLDLKQVRKLMPGLFIAEQDAPSGDFLWRLAGTAVTALMEREVTGRSITEGWDSFESGTIRRFLSGVSGTHRPGLLRMRFLTDRGQWIVAEMVAMPLMSADGQTTQVLGGLFAFPDPDLKHYESLKGRELLSARQADGERAAAPSPAPGRFRVINGGRG
ncbi:PAS domain-containing protein [Aestuariivirga sp.]|uniref:PAS domain-containing protein n=1 Tax=Aestuariivirga sp. TaxID=2650926 RepID=UPI003783F974